MAAPFPTQGWQLPDAELATLQHYRLVGSASVAPLRVGERVSPRFGLGYDFADYQPYQIGDRLQHVDWARYEISGRREVFVRKFYEERPATNALVVDLSASLSAFESDRKLDAVAGVAALLLHLSAAHHEPVDLFLLGGEGLPEIDDHGYLSRKELASSLEVSSVCDEIAPLRAGGASPFRDLGAQELGFGCRYGATVVLSDFFMPGDDWVPAVHEFRERSTRLHLCQFISARDLEPFPTARDLEWVDAETGRVVESRYDPASHRRHVEAHAISPVIDAAVELDANYARLPCEGDPVEVLLGAYVLEES